MITEQADLTDRQRDDVLDLVGRAQRVDRTSPLNEAARLALMGPGSTRIIHWLSHDHDGLVGYADAYYPAFGPMLSNPLEFFATPAMIAAGQKAAKEQQ